MAITAAQLQTALGVGGNGPQVLKHDAQADGTTQSWYVHGRVTYPGRVRWIRYTSTTGAQADRRRRHATTALGLLALHPETSRFAR
jgi:hypothetical protein